MSWTIISLGLMIWNVGWNYLSSSKLQRWIRWSLGIDKELHPTFYNGCNNLSMLGLKLNHVKVKLFSTTQSDPLTILIWKVCGIRHFKYHGLFIQFQKSIGVSRLTFFLHENMILCLWRMTWWITFSWYMCVCVCVVVRVLLGDESIFKCQSV